MNIPFGYRKRKRNDQCWCGSGRKSKKCHPEPPPKTLIIISGAPCTGKSTVREALANLLPEPHSEIDFDAIVKGIVDKNHLPEVEFGRAFAEARSLIVKQAEHTITISDLLADNSRLREMQTASALREVATFSILLHCDINIREARDAKRHAINPAAPHGFLEGLVPEHDVQLFDLIVDTAQSDPSEISESILNTVRQSIWSNN